MPLNSLKWWGVGNRMGKKGMALLCCFSLISQMWSVHFSLLPEFFLYVMYFVCFTWSPSKTQLWFPWFLVQNRNLTISWQINFKPSLDSKALCNLALTFLSYSTFHLFLYISTVLESVWPACFYIEHINLLPIYPLSLQSWISERRYTHCKLL